jgi:hypothetical protein
VRPLLHLLSIILVLPSVVLASAFIILGRAIATQSLLGVFGQLLADAVWLIPWGLLAACAIVLLVALGGFFVQTRRLAGLCVATLGIGSTVVLLVLTISHSNASLGQLPFLLLGIVSSGIGLWLAFIERSRGQNAASAA